MRITSAGESLPLVQRHSATISIPVARSDCFLSVIRSGEILVVSQKESGRDLHLCDSRRSDGYSDAGLCGIHVARIPAALLEILYSAPGTAPSIRATFSRYVHSVEVDEKFIATHRISLYESC